MGGGGWERGEREGDWIAAKRSRVKKPHSLLEPTPALFESSSTCGEAGNAGPTRRQPPVGRRGSRVGGLAARLATCKTAPNRAVLPAGQACHTRAVAQNSAFGAAAQRNAACVRQGRPPPIAAPARGMAASAPTPRSHPAVSHATRSLPTARLATRTTDSCVFVGEGAACAAVGHAHVLGARPLWHRPRPAGSWLMAAAHALRSSEAAARPADTPPLELETLTKLVHGGKGGGRTRAWREADEQTEKNG